MKPDKICHLTSVHTWTDTRILHKECASLAQNGFEVHLVVANQPGEPHHPLVHIHNVSQPAGNRLTRVWKTTAAVYRKALELDADLYHFHDPELLPVGRKLKGKGKKVVYDSHEHLPNQIRTKSYLPRAIRPLLAWLADRFEKTLVSRLDAVITVLESLQERFLPHNPNTIVVKNYASLEEPAFSKKWDEKPRDATYVGIINEVRGMGAMMDALEKPGHWRLTLVGNFESAELEQRMRQRPGWDRTDFLGYQQRAQVAEILADSKVGLVTLLDVPKHRESLPTKLFEYMAASIPVVCSTIPKWQEIVDGAECGICVDPNDPAAIATAVGYLLSHPEEAQTMGKRGRAALESTYNWATEEKKLVHLYEKLLSDRPQ
jgi:glycosyltransferase involved in cell wall biosynthesis